MTLDADSAQIAEIVRLLPVARGELLRQVAELGEASVDELAELRGVNRNAIRSQLLKLEQAGLVEHYKVTGSIGRPKFKYRVTHFDRDDSLLDAASSEMYVIDAETYKFQRVSRGAADNLGYSHEQLLQLGLRDISAADHVEAVEHAQVQAAKGSGHVSFISAHRRKDGSIYPVELDIRLMDDPATTLMAIATDLSQQQAVERTLKEREDRLAVLFDEAPDAILVTNRGRAGMIIQEFNAQACELLRYTSAQLQRMSFRDLMDASGPAQAMSPIDAEGEGDVSSSERELKRGDGTTLLVDIRAKLLSNDTIMLVLRDISEREKAARAIAQSERQIRTLFDAWDDAVVLINSGDESLIANRTACELLGYRETDLAGLHYRELLDPSDSEDIQLLTADQPYSKTRERVFRRGDGTLITVEVKARRISEETIWLTMRDLTETKEAEDRAEERETRLALLFAEADDGIIIIDQNNGDVRILESNRAAANLLGFRPQELVGMQYGDLVAADELDRASRGLKGLRAGDVIRRNRRLVKSDGSTVSVRINAKVLSDGNVMVVFRAPASFGAS